MLLQIFNVELAPIISETGFGAVKRLGHNGSKSAGAESDERKHDDHCEPIYSFKAFFIEKAHSCAPLFRKLKIR